MTAVAERQPLLEISDLKVQFQTREGLAQVVDLEHLSVAEGETFGLAGESGAGKTVVALSIFRLVPSPPGVIAGGRILLRGQDLLAMREEELRRIRGRKTSMIFQDPMSSLNPVFTVGQQVIRVIRTHHRLSRREAEEKAAQVLEVVRLPDPGGILAKYPHELSGGMRQRVMIAMGLSCGAELLIADEPTRGLDVTIQAGILNLLNEIKRDTGMTVLFIANNLGVLAQMCSRVGVMYAGRIVEVGAAGDVFQRPAHPYTRALLAALPRAEMRSGRLAVTEGFPPDPLRIPPGCSFRPRCPQVVPLCESERPQLREAGPGRLVACHLAG
ncbi:MAG: ABC transporter ATP-binding protein [Firmicutes bacterium]|nr:ABC transporter ATP-binding protein [Bacillota bacterium]